jgi:hypothetical protein
MALATSRRAALPAVAPAAVTAATKVAAGWWAASRAGVVSLVPTRKERPHAQIQQEPQRQRRAAGLDP